MRIVDSIPSNFTGTTGIRVVIYDPSGNPISTGAPADDIANAAIIGLDTRSFPELYDEINANWNRWRQGEGNGTAIIDGAGAVIPHFWSSNNNFTSAHSANDVGDNTGGQAFGSTEISVFDQLATNFNRLRQANNDGTALNDGIVAGAVYLFNAANQFTVQTTAGTLTDADTATSYPGIAPMFYNGATRDRARNSSAANLSATTKPFNLLVANPGEWAQGHAPAVNVQATTTKAAGGAGVRHVCRSIAFSMFAAAALGPIQVNLRDGASGAGTILWTMTVQAGVGGFIAQAFSGLNIFGSANTAMTLEFSAAGGAADSESVSFSGYSA